MHRVASILETDFFFWCFFFVNIFVPSFLSASLLSESSCSVAAWSQRVLTRSINTRVYAEKGSLFSESGKCREMEQWNRDDCARNIESLSFIKRALARRVSKTTCTHAKFRAHISRSQFVFLYLSPVPRRRERKNFLWCNECVYSRSMLRKKEERKQTTELFLIISKWFFSFSLSVSLS